VTTPEDTATNLVLSASDPDGNSLTFIIVSAPTNGRAEPDQYKCGYAYLHAHYELQWR
jgi:hypothetical protein